MSEVIGRLSHQKLQQPIEKSRFGPAAEDRLVLKEREAHRRINERMKLIDNIDHALRQISSKRQDEITYNRTRGEL